MPGRRTGQVPRQQRAGEGKVQPHQLQEEFFPTGARFSEATDLSCHLPLVAVAPFQERLAKYRGARTEVIGKISYMTNSAIVFRRDTLEVTGLSYPISFVPDRS